jgi:hypothetical protein
LKTRAAGAQDSALSTEHFCLTFALRRISIKPSSASRNHSDELNMNMEKDETIAAHEKRRQAVHADDDDILVRVLDIPEANYECVMVNNSWLERGLLEGDIILFAARDNPEEGDIVLIEEDQHTRLGVASVPSYLQTTQGSRPLNWSERIVGVGVALARNLGMKRET